MLKLKQKLIEEKQNATKKATFGDSGSGEWMRPSVLSQSRMEHPPIPMPIRKHKKKDKKKKRKTTHKQRMEPEYDSDNSSEEEEEVAWEHPEDLDKAEIVQNLDAIIPTLKAPLVVWDHSKTLLGEKSDDNFIQWLGAYAKHECVGKRKRDDMVFNDNI